jgi:hypothetical protein
MEATLEHQADQAEQTAAAAIPAIGAFWSAAGGINAGLMRGINGAPDYWLILCDDKAQPELEYGSYGVDEPGAASDHDGQANTRALIESTNPHPAAEFAGEARCNGKSDWYIPACREYRLLVANVPELFDKDWYWTSTQYSRYYAWFQYFGDGNQLTYGKAFKFKVALVRRFNP